MDSERAGKPVIVDVYKPSDLFALEEGSVSPLNFLWLLDKVTRDHSYRMEKLSGKMAEYMDCNTEEIQDIRKAALYHDLGKVVMQSIISNKRSLTDEEKTEIRRHPIYTDIILSKIPELNKRSIRLYTRQHHENHDGSGYPYGLSGNDISSGARIINICDDFDASVDPSRIYNGRVLSVNDMVKEMIESIGKEYDPEIAYAFIGTLLSNKELLHRLYP